MDTTRMLLVVFLVVYISTLGKVTQLLLIPPEGISQQHAQINRLEDYLYLCDDSNIIPSVAWETNLNGSFLYAVLSSNRNVLIIHSVEINTSSLTILDIETGQTKNTKLLYGVKKVIMCITIDNSILIVHESGIIRLDEQNLTEIWNISTPLILSTILIPNYQGETAVAVAYANNVSIYAISNGFKLGTYNVNGETVAMALGHEPEAIYILTKQNTQILWLNGTSKIIQEQRADLGRIIVCDLNHNNHDDIVTICWSEKEWRYNITIIIDGEIQKNIEAYTDHLHLPFYREPIVILDDIDADSNIDIVYENVTCRPPYTIYYTRYVNILCYDIAGNRSSVLFTTNWYRPSKVATVDLDGDRMRDIILCIEGYQVSDVVEIRQKIESCTYDGQAIAYIDVPGYPREKIIVEGLGAIIYCGQTYTQNGTYITVQRIDLGVQMYNTYWGKQLLTKNLVEIDADKDLLSYQCEIELSLNPENQDTDNDTLPDGWEYMNELDPLDPADAALDSDNDGLNNTMEYMYRGDPWYNDTDDDGLSDLQEVEIGTDLRNNDTDFDGMPDGWEVLYGLNATNPSDANIDSDGDGLINIEEYHYNTNPMSNDTDNDGMLDDWEIIYGLNATNPNDADIDLDGDGLTNLEEYHYGTNPRSEDSDGDGYGDGYEVSHGTDPLDPSDHPISLIRRYWLVPIVFVIVIVALAVFLSKRRIFIGE